jgi:hypothetical protein
MLGHPPNWLKVDQLYEAASLVGGRNKAGRAMIECCSGDTCETDHNLAVGYKRG